MLEYEEGEGYEERIAESSYMTAPEMVGEAYVPLLLDVLGYFSQDTTSEAVVPGFATTH
jgi:hypothetical protein